MMPFTSSSSSSHSSSSLLLFVVLATVGCLSLTEGWVNPTVPSRQSTTKHSVSLLATLDNAAAAASSPSLDPLGGVAQFDGWFKKLDKADCQPSVQHGSIGSLRGLLFSGAKVSEPTTVLKVPQSVVLRASYGNEDWDVELAESLWAECLRGTSSEYYG